MIPSVKMKLNLYSAIFLQVLSVPRLNYALEMIPRMI